VFFVLAVEKMRKRNTSNGTMTRRGYEAMQLAYQEKTGLRHDVRQLRNRWNQLKGIYSSFKWANIQQELDVSTMEGLMHPLSWWERHRKVMII
jgi:hypothetical protein